MSKNVSEKDDLNNAIDKILRDEPKEEVIERKKKVVPKKEEEELFITDIGEDD